MAIKMMEDINRSIERRAQERDDRLAVSRFDLHRFLFEARVRMHADMLCADDMDDAAVIRWALQPYCDDENPRFTLGDPFIRDPDTNWVYATDSRICVRVGIHAEARGILADWQQAEGRRPVARDVFHGDWDRSQFVPFRPRRSQQYPHLARLGCEHIHIHHARALKLMPDVLVQMPTPNYGPHQSRWESTAEPIKILFAGGQAVVMPGIVGE